MSAATRTESTGRHVGRRLMHGEIGSASFSSWMRLIQSKYGLIRPGDIEELFSFPTNVSAEPQVEPDCITQCVGLPCLLAGAQDARFSSHHGSTQVVRTAFCVGRCWQAPVSVARGVIVSASTGEAQGDLTQYLRSGGYGVYRNCLSRRRSVESVIDTLSRPSFALPNTRWTLGKSLRAINAETTGAALIISLDRVSPGDMSSAFHVEHHCHELIEGLLIVASVIATSEIIVYCSAIQRPAAARIEGELRQLSDLKFAFPAPIRFTRELHPSDFGVTAMLLVEPEILCRVPMALAVGCGPLRGASGGSGSLALFAITGRVAAPSVVLAPLNVTFRRLLAMAEGMAEGHSFDGFIAGAWYRPALGEEHLDLTIDEPEISGGSWTAYPICFLSKEAPILRQHAFGP